MRKLTLLIFLCLIQLTYAQRKGYWQQKVDYKIYVDMKESSYQYNGKMKLKYTNNSGESLDKVYFHLYYNAFQPGSMMDYRLQNIADPDKRMVRNIGTKESPQLISRITSLKPDQIGYQKIISLKQHGKDLAYKVNGTILEVTLVKPIKAGKTETFDMVWSAQIPEQIRRTGRNSKDNVEFSMAQWYPKMAEFDSEGWHLDEYVGREFFAPFGNFDVTINIDKDYVLGASGELQNPNNVKGYVNSPTIKENNGKASWNFKASNIHDFVWAADKNFVVDHGKTKNGVDIYLVYKNDATGSFWKEAMPYTIGFFDYTSEHFGDYPWKTYSIIQGGDGGMEYGTATLISGNRKLESLVNTIFHEGAHSWYQQLFGINETYNEWFDEGFTSYVQQMAYLNVYKKLKVIPSNPNIPAYKGYIDLALSGQEEPASLLADYYNSNYAYSLQAYYKGQVLAIQLGYIIGKDNLDKTFLKFYDLWKFKHPSGNDFKRVAEEVSGINLKWYFNLFLNTTRKIDYAVENVTNNTISLANKSNFAMPIDVLVEYTDGTKELFYIPLREMRGKKPAENLVEYQGAKRTILPDWFWTKPTYDFKVSKDVKQVTIDPTERLADVHPKNNIFIK